jgi:hypothetical protein
MRLFYPVQRHHGFVAKENEFQVICGMSCANGLLLPEFSAGRLT